ncbi:DUF302 domain-containing protein [Paracoccus sp. Z330]|uniref:DUF302 domain-containing protein n=1 Tax=Paracoccus onchidii TaxID=3017813 RepID=A0ABT4ZEB4_9RHOB|nr:DUF302 domain-containing protein [Paracoccus onchidii]MDB6177650.1 DUF302 domain-containing protein [Paracoccus onchidii]
MPRLMTALIASIALAGPALADLEEIPAEGSVAEVADRLETAITEAGANLFLRVDHAEGAASVDMELADSQLLVFGNPKLGTLPMQQDIRAGLHLPLKMLVFSQDGETRIAWEEPDEMFDDLDIDDDAPYLAKMDGALKSFAQKAAGTQ